MIDETDGEGAENLSVIPLERVHQLLAYNAKNMVEFITDIAEDDELAAMLETQNLPVNASELLVTRLRSNHMLECLIFFLQETQRLDSRITQQLRKVEIGKKELGILEAKIKDLELCLMDK